MLAFLAFSTRKLCLRRVLLMCAGTPSCIESVAGLYSTHSSLQAVKSLVALFVFALFVCARDGPQSLNAVGCTAQV